MIVTGNAGANNLAGAELADIVRGLGGNDTLSGLGGDDTLDGGAGIDAMAGGDGDDTYIVDDEDDVVTEAANGGADAVRSLITLALADDVEDLTLLGTANLNAVGNELDNLLTGNDGNNVLNGGAGIDRMAGGAGNDVYVVENGLDRVIELAAGGFDTVLSAVSYALAPTVENLTLLGAANLNGAGNSANNVITGNVGSNVLNGGLGNDRMAGRAGDDTYFVNTRFDRVIEVPGGGTDAVRSAITYTLGANLENLTLLGPASINGTGNVLFNSIFGNAGSNVLNGGFGNDTMWAGSATTPMASPSWATSSSRMTSAAPTRSTAR